MTSDKNAMPKVIFMADKDGDCHDKGQWVVQTGDPDFPVKYLRADTVIELLKQIRGHIEFCKKHNHWQPLNNTLALIDKALGETK